jgi:hypothetical protein
LVEHPGWRKEEGYLYRSRNLAVVASHYTGVSGLSDRRLRPQAETPAFWGRKFRPPPGAEQFFDTEAWASLGEQVDRKVDLGAETPGLEAGNSAPHQELSKSSLLESWASLRDKCRSLEHRAETPVRRTGNSAPLQGMNTLAPHGKGKVSVGQGPETSGMGGNSGP